MFTLVSACVTCDPDTCNIEKGSLIIIFKTFLKLLFLVLQANVNNISFLSVYIHYKRFIIIFLF